LRASSAAYDRTTNTCPGTDTDTGTYTYTRTNTYAYSYANANAGTYSINRNADIRRHYHLPPGRRPDQLR
jgi:hypothetical protein